MARDNDKLEKGMESIEVSIKVNGKPIFYRVASFVEFRGQSARYVMDDGTEILTPRDPENLKPIAQQILNR